MVNKTKKRVKRGKGIGKWKIFSNKNKNNNNNNVVLSTIEQLEEISKPINEVKKVFEEHSNKIDILYNNCLNSCNNYDCLGNDTLCDDIKTFIDKEPLYNWTNFCAHSLNQESCKEFLQSYKILDIYTKKLIELGKKAELVKELLDAYNKPINKLINKPINISI